MAELERMAVFVMCLQLLGLWRIGMDRVGKQRSMLFLNCDCGK